MQVSPYHIATVPHLRNEGHGSKASLIALAVKGDGFPLPLEVLPGNTARHCALSCTRLGGNTARHIAFPSGEVLRQMPLSDSPISYLVGTPKVVAANWKNTCSWKSSANRLKSKAADPPSA